MSAIDLAIADIGTVEWSKAGQHNPKVVAYFKDAGHPEVVDDETAWCAALVGAMLARAGIKPSGELDARSYLKWGTKVAVIDAARGDIGVIPRGNSSWQGHVFFIEKTERGVVHAVGGNQRDSVSRATFPAASLLGVRRALINAKDQQKAAVVITPAPPKPVVFAETQNTDIKTTFWAALIALFTRKGN